MFLPRTVLFLLFPKFDINGYKRALYRLKDSDCFSQNTGVRQKRRKAKKNAPGMKKAGEHWVVYEKSAVVSGSKGSGEGNLQIEAAGVAVHVQHLAGKVKTGQQLGLHRLGIDL